MSLHFRDPPALKRADETRLLLLEATINALLELGFARTTMLEVARRAAVSRGALLHHFPSRAELLCACVEYLAELRGFELSELARELPADESRTAAAIDLLWQSFSGPLFCVALELRNAARTDDEFRAVLVGAEIELRGRILRQSRALFGDAAKQPGFECALDMTLQLMIGAAASTNLHRAEATRAETLINRWKSIFPTMLADPKEHAHE